MATTKKVQLPEGFDPYDMRLKRQFSDQADKMNVIALSRKNYNLCCGAMHNGQPCKNPAGMGTPHKGYGRCKIHGGLATGPKTAEGRARQIAASTKHGLFSKVLLPEEESILESINQEEEFNALDMMIKVQTVKIVSYLQKHKDRFVKDRDLEGEEVAYRKSRVICREGDGMKTFYHAGTIEDNALDRAMNTLRRLIGQKHLIEGKDDGPDDIMASKSEEVVKELVTKKMQYSDAAKKLSQGIQESYYNASRIIRTEMTRANALGTSYSLMENADIVDGKYRDATFDSKTSAYCAADADYSKRNPYDLDYDTPMNPGLPGRRIPNHPHCRCRWVAILSGLGIKNRQKAALDKYGDLYYTKAASYDEYAKEVGLPSVKDMVNADNPKKYLRPGETLADLNRQVVRKRFNGQIITVPLGLDIHN